MGKTKVDSVKRHRQRLTEANEAYFILVNDIQYRVDSLQVCNLLPVPGLLKLKLSKIQISLEELKSLLKVYIDITTELQNLPVLPPSVDAQVKKKVSQGKKAK